MCDDSVPVLARLRRTRWAGLLCTAVQDARSRGVGRSILAGCRQIHAVQQSVGFVDYSLLLCPWTAQPTAQNPTKGVGVLAAHALQYSNYTKPAPQFPPTREAPPSVPSLLPGGRSRQDYVWMQSGACPPCPPCPALPALPCPALCSCSSSSHRCLSRPPSLPTAATSFLCGSGDYVTSQKESRDSTISPRQPD